MAQETIITDDNINDLVRKYLLNKPLLPLDLRVIAIGEWNVRRVTKMNNLFDGSTIFNEPLNGWDVSNVIDMTAMFYECENFNQELTNWDVSKVKNMSGMFDGCQRFNQELDNWNVSSVINMEFMFNECQRFNKKLNDWDVSNVVNMSNMFKACEIFNQPLNHWNVSNVVDMSDMFFGCENFNQPLNGWDVSNVSNSEGIFDNGCKIDEENKPLFNTEFMESIEMEEGGPKSCTDEITMIDVDYKKYLAHNPKNFILIYGKVNNKKCSSLNSLIKIANTNNNNIPDSFYECSREIIEKAMRTGITPSGFGPDDYIHNVEYVKVDNIGTYIVKPEWIFNGVPPEPRIFRLVPSGNSKFLVSKGIINGINIFSGVHCDQRDNFMINNLVPLTQQEIDAIDSAVSGGKRKTKKNNRKNTKNKKNKYKKNIRKTKNKNKNKKGGKKKKTIKKYIKKIL
jgi:surface protein